MSKFLWTSKDGPPPKHHYKKQADPLDRVQEWLQFRAMILSGKMKPAEQIGFRITPELKRITGLEKPWRIARQRLREILRESGLDSDYSVQMFKPDPEQPEYHFIMVTYEPPLVKSKKQA